MAEFVTIKPKLKEYYSQNIIENIYMFLMHNKSCTEKFHDIDYKNNIITIILKYRDFLINLKIQVPFDYPYNFDINMF